AGAHPDEDVLVAGDGHGPLLELEPVGGDEHRRRHGRGNRHGRSFRGYAPRAGGLASIAQRISGVWPRSRAISSRSWYFWIFPLGVIGKASRISSRSGSFQAAMRWLLRKAIISSNSRAGPGGQITNAHTRSARTGSGMATHATLDTFGWVNRSSSI